MKLNNQKFKNVSLKVFWNDKTRPFISRTRIDTFNIISNYFNFKDKIILDLFCGSGILGIESLSLGAKICYFNDNNYLNIKNLKKNLQKLRISNFKSYCYDYKRLLNFFLKNNIFFNVIFLDPPFTKKNYNIVSLEFLNKNFSIYKDLEIIVLRSTFLFDFDNFLKIKNAFEIRIKKYSYYYIYILIRNKYE